MAAAYNAGRFEEALRLLRGVKGAEAELLRGHCLSSLGRRKEAISRFSGLLRRAGATEREIDELTYDGPPVAPTVPTATAEERVQLPLRAAEAALQRGERDQARALWERALETAAGNDRVSILLNLGRYPEAFQAAEALDEEYRHPWAVFGDSRERLAEHVAGLEALRRRGGHGPWPGFLLFGLSPLHADAIEDVAGHLSPKYDFMRELLAQHRLKKERYEGVLEAAAGSLAAWRVDAYAAEALLCLGRRREALARMRLACRRAPERDRIDARAWLGELLLWDGSYAAAKRELEPAYKAGSPYSYCWLGAALYKLGSPNRALKILDEGLERYPRDVEAYAWKGEILRRLGKTKQAVAALKIEALREDFGGKLSTPLEGPAGDSWSWHVANLALAGKNAKAEAGRMSARLLALIGLDLERSGERETRAALEGLLEKARGCRRPEAYTWSVWLGTKERPI